jgi:hypothetical protein
MNKSEIKKIKSFFSEINQLPDNVLSNTDINILITNNSSREDRDALFVKQAKLIETFEDVIIRLLAYTLIPQIHRSYDDCRINIIPSNRNLIQFKGLKDWTKQFAPDGL